MRFWLLVEVVGTLVAVGLIVVSVLLEPDPHGQGTAVQLGLPPCGHLERTGQPCLTCGMTTSFAHMAHLEPVAAVEAHPAAAALFLVVLVAPFWLVHALVTRRDPFRFVRHRLGRFLLPALLVLTLGVWMARTAG